jgi:hypothetical protein
MPKNGSPQSVVPTKALPRELERQAELEAQEMRRFLALSPEEQADEIDREQYRMHRVYKDIIHQHQRQAQLVPFQAPAPSPAPPSEESITTERSEKRKAWMQERHPDWGLTDWRAHTSLAYETLQRYHNGLVTSRTPYVRGRIAKAEMVAVSIVPE